MRENKIYYGLSGTLKSTTINGYFVEERKVIIRSAIKVWKQKRDLLFPWLKGETNLNYALLHLTRLQEYVYGDYEFIIERGVTDPLYYEQKVNPDMITPLVISSAVKQESEILGGEPQKILMIMLDKDFIKKKTLSEETRAQWFKGVEDYLEKQKEYVEYTKKYNNITEIIEIKDAESYLKRFGIEYNV